MVVTTLRFSYIYCLHSLEIPYYIVMPIHDSISAPQALDAYEEKLPLRQKKTACQTTVPIGKYQEQLFQERLTSQCMVSNPTVLRTTPTVLTSERGRLDHLVCGQTSGIAIANLVVEDDTPDRRVIIWVPRVLG